MMTAMGQLGWSEDASAGVSLVGIGGEGPEFARGKIYLEHFGYVVLSGADDRRGIARVGRERF